jgi:hypothetical protein
MSEEPPTGWRAWFPSMEERAERRRQRLERLAETDSLRARIEMVIGVLTIIGVVVLIVVNILR